MASNQSNVLGKILGLIGAVSIIVSVFAFFSFPKKGGSSKTKQSANTEQASQPKTVKPAEKPAKKAAAVEEEEVTAAEKPAAKTEQPSDKNFQEFYKEYEKIKPQIDNRARNVETLDEQIRLINNLLEQYQDQRDTKLYKDLDKLLKRNMSMRDMF